jgi:chromosome segregation ATPase
MSDVRQVANVEVSGRDADATEANVARLEGMRDECEHGSLRRKCQVCSLTAELAQEKAEYDNVSRQLDKTAAERDAAHRERDTVDKQLSFLREQYAAMTAERDEARAEVSRLRAWSIEDYSLRWREFERSEKAEAEVERARDYGLRMDALAEKRLSRVEGLAADIRKARFKLGENVVFDVEAIDAALEKYAPESKPEAGAP